MCTTCDQVRQPGGTVKSLQGTETSRAQLHEWMDEAREALRLSWADVARAMDMTEENLLRIRRGRIGISLKAAKKIEDALQWEPGSVEAAVRKGERPEALDDLESRSDQTSSSASGSHREWTEVDLMRFRLLEQLFESWGEEMTSAKVEVVLAELQRRLTTDSPQRTGQAGGQSDADSKRPPVRGTSK